MMDDDELRALSLRWLRIGYWTDAPFAVAFSIARRPLLAAIFWFGFAVCVTLHHRWQAESA